MRVESARRESDIEANGFEILQEYRYPVTHDTLGELEFIPAIDRALGRVVLFFIDAGGGIAFRTDDVESNRWFRGELRQPNVGVPGIALRDLDGDGLADIVLICECENPGGAYAGRRYNVGEALFQRDGGFYRDWRISRRLNDLNMGKNLDSVTLYIRDGISLEYLYTSKTPEELLDAGFHIIEGQRTQAYFEKFGLVSVIPGFATFNGQAYLMIYLVNPDGKIIWNFQPMYDYVNFYKIKGVSFRDVDGDGLGDFTLLAEYIRIGAEEKAEIVADYNVYYQRTGYFEEDINVKKVYACGADDELDDVVSAVARIIGQNGA